MNEVILRHNAQFLLESKEYNILWQPVSFYHVFNLNNKYKYRYILETLYEETTFRTSLPTFSMGFPAKRLEPALATAPIMT